MAKKESKKSQISRPKPDQPPATPAVATGDKMSGSEKLPNFPLVGIGASAGGLAALKEFFKHVPTDSGFAFVVVVHLAPDYKSHLAELLQPHVSMPVIQVNQTLSLEPNHVYVIPPNANLETIDTHLRLAKLEEARQARAPIDHFFRTLASTHNGEAIGVVLTGTGSDGTLGMREIKQCGGLTVVQDPNEAEYDGMPQSVIAIGVADMVLPLAKIPQAILKYAEIQPKLPAVKETEDLDTEAMRLVQKIFAQLRARTGRDFTRYKRSTVLRRIQRRMQLKQIENLSSYLDNLREQPEEATVLADDLLITVTSFFRDAEVFNKLAKGVIPELFKGKTADDDIRVWSVGCATGEEAYSLAILLLEESARHDSPPRIQVFASDLHENSLKRARDGFYPGDVEADISAERLRRFFCERDRGLSGS